MERTAAALENEEVDFLLKSESGAAVASSAEVTMRGDLEQMNLADLFQTFAMSKMQGRLHLRTAVEHRDIFFLDGFVRNFMPARLETRRLGQQLIQAGLVSVEQMRTLLLEQKRSRKPLDQVVADSGLVDTMQLQEITIGLAAEDLYSIFTWAHGTFEFYKGPCEDPVVQQRLETLHSFEGSGLLLEVARRSDEWERIVEVLHSPDEIVQQVDGVDTSGLSADAASVLAAVDGQLSVRELGETSRFGLFETARLLRELRAGGYVEHVDDEWVLQVADLHVQRGDVKRAVQTLRTLYDRSALRELDVTRRMCALLHRCGESKLAARFSIEATEAEEELNDRLELARDARRFDSRSVEVLSCLRTMLQQREAPHDDELVAVTDELVEAMADAGQIEAAAAILDSDAIDVAADPAHAMRRAMMLNRLGRSEQAIETLMAVAEAHKAAGRSDRLAATYEQILKIDYRRKDVARLLKAIHAGRIARNLRKLIVIGVSIAATGIGWLVYRDHRRSSEVAELTAAVQELLSRDDSDGAQALLAERAEHLGEDPGVDDLRMRIQQVEFRRKNDRMRKLDDDRKQRVNAVLERIEHGDLRAVVNVLDSMPEKGEERSNLERTAKAKLMHLLPRLETAARDLPFAVPESPNALQTEAQRVQVLRDLDTRFRAIDREQAEGIHAAGELPTLVALLGPDEMRRMTTAAAAIREVFARVEVIRKRYEDAQNESDLARRLDPVFITAREHSARFEFDEALAAYRKLSTDYHRDDELRAHIRDQVERHAAIVRHLETVRRACTDGDFATARTQLRTLRRTYPDIPFDRIVALPLEVETVPGGAQVTLNGKVVGKTPLRTAYTPAIENRIRVELPGFLPEETTLKGDEIAKVRSLLARAPRWTWTAGGAIERAAANADGAVVVVDRSGAVSCVGHDGTLRWTAATGDLSGLLPKPLVVGDQVVVASVDGTLRGFALGDGTRKFATPGLPVAADPVLVGPFAVVGTTDGYVVAVEARTGEERWRTPVGAPIRAGIAAIDSQIFVATVPGEVLALRAHSGDVAWRAKLPRGILGRPAAAGQIVVAAAEDGTTTAFRATDGQVLWTRGGLGEVTQGLAITPGVVHVPVDQSVVSLALDSGATLRTFDAMATLSSPLTSVGGLLWAGNRLGIVAALDPTTLEARFLVRGGRRASAAPTLGATGFVVLGFEDRTLIGVELR